MKWVAWICLLVFTGGGVFSRAESNPTDERLTQLAVQRLQKICGNEVVISVSYKALTIQKDVQQREIERPARFGSVIGSATESQMQTVVETLPVGRGFAIRIDIDSKPYPGPLACGTRLVWDVARMHPDIYSGCSEAYADIPLIDQKLYAFTRVTLGRWADTSAVKVLFAKVIEAITEKQEGISFCDTVLASYPSSTR
ncbi:MAG: hypothetical protein B9S32_14060 [Verrucomicrobia bacterium Tous-C9LFEB]|nr:MAG: hypothetical protein B9S32_14060 [Verrucomicrobia bacterium Tous-C9LFEB]